MQHVGPCPHQSCTFFACIHTLAYNTRKHEPQRNQTHTRRDDGQAFRKKTTNEEKGNGACSRIFFLTFFFKHYRASRVIDRLWTSYGTTSYLLQPASPAQFAPRIGKEFVENEDLSDVRFEVQGCRSCSRRRKNTLGRVWCSDFYAAMFS
eukprot:m.369811 g.369811  ORF g.369811 m.369811 type:complete len:150 (+) comp19990_c0_seq15:2389-2838(+)